MSKLFVNSVYRAGFLVIVLLSLAACGALESDSRPNILLIVLDDMGYNDLGANGNPDVTTPNLDQFAQQGINYRRHYADASCTVARTALLTGNYPAYYGMRPTRLGISPGTPTIASMLQEAGYFTQHIGKWHVGNPTLKQSPLAVGFDAWFGFLFQHELGGPSEDGINFAGPRYRDPWLRTNDTAARQHRGHLTDILTRRAVEFVGDRRGSSDPWFLNLWYYAPHMPVQPAARFAVDYPETDAGRYLALLQQVDDGIGSVLAALSDSGQADDTLVIILSDNGANSFSVDSNFPFHGRKTQYFEGGVRTPLLLRWPGHVPAGVASSELVSLFDIMPTLAAAAAADLPPRAIGRDLLADQLPVSPQLFWEVSSSDSYTFAVLSRDGRWRYVAGSAVAESLNDLAEDPTGKTNVIEEFPEEAARLREDYRLWRREQRPVEFSYGTLNERGGARLTGNDVLRTPGHGGFTFGIGVTPQALGDEPQAIVHQDGRWGVYATRESTLLGLAGELIPLPPLPAGQCSELVVSSHHRFSPVWPGLNTATIEVFVDARKVGGATTSQPELHLTGYESPTYLGMSAPKESVFAGTLGRPLILNERVKLEGSSALLGDSVLDLPPLCL